MTKTQRIRSRIASQEKVIQIHEEKVDREQRQPNPNWRLIGHWQAEIHVAHQKIAQLQRRLEALRRRR